MVQFFLKQYRRIKYDILVNLSKHQLSPTPRFFVLATMFSCRSRQRQRQLSDVLIVTTVFRFKERERRQERESGGDYFGKKYFNFNLKLKKHLNYFGKKFKSVY
jgi:hypothetical protein